MKNYGSVALLFFLTAFLSFSGVAAQQDTIFVSGKVVDSITGAPIPNATLLLYATASYNISPNNLGDLKLDTVYSDANGDISHTMSVIQNAFILVYGVIKQDYQIYYSVAGIQLQFNIITVNLGTIKLQKVDVLVKDTIVVSGAILDSSTGMGIDGAQVIMSGLGSFDTTGNTVLTGSDGKFSKQVIAGNAVSDTQLIYLVSKDGYRPMVGQQYISGKTLDLGTILLKRNTQGIIASAAPVRMPRAAVVTGVYTLKGQLVSVGPFASGNPKLFRHSGVAVAVFRNQNGDARAKKVMATK